MRSTKDSGRSLQVQVFCVLHLEHPLSPGSHRATPAAVRTLPILMGFCRITSNWSFLAQPLLQVSCVLVDSFYQQMELNRPLELVLDLGTSSDTGCYLSACGLSDNTWDHVTCLKAMAKTVLMQVGFFFQQFWPKPNHISFVVLSDFTRTICSHHTHKNRTLLPEGICDLVMPISASLISPSAHRVPLASESIFSYNWKAACKYPHEGSCTSRSLKSTGLKALCVLLSKSMQSKACTVTGILLSRGQTC